MSSNWSTFRGVDGESLSTRGSGWAAILLVVALFGALVGTTAVEAFPDDVAAVTKDSKESWPMFRGSPSLTGVYRGNLPEKLEILWEFEAEEAVDVSAAIQGGKVYFAVFEGDFICVDFETGKEIWRRGWKEDDGYQVPINSSPSVALGMVFFGNEDGKFFALDAETGADRWTFETQGEIISSPVVVGDSVLFGSYDGFLYCLKPSDGTFKWKVETEGKIHATPGVGENRVLIAGCDEHLRVLNLADGKEVHAIAMGSPSGSSAAMLGSRVFVGTYGNQVLGIDFLEGKVLWRYEHPDRQFPFVSSAAVTEEIVVIGGRDKMVHGLNPDTGKSLWTFRTKGRVEASPVIVGDRVFFGSYDGKFYELDLKTGKENWVFEAGGPIHASPSISEGRLVLGTGDGVVYCFGAKSSK